jgi:hypothetical protein
MLSTDRQVDKGRTAKTTYPLRPYLATPGPSEYLEGKVVPGENPVHFRGGRSPCLGLVAEHVEGEGMSGDSES